MLEERVVASLADVTKNYGNVEAIRRIDLRIHAGEAVALLGPNGAGKTTAVSLLLGTVKPTSGLVRVFGNDPAERATRRRMGAMLQISGVPETLRVGEHIELFRSYYPKALEHGAVIAAAGLAGLEKRMYGKLSGGQKQRVHLAIALCGNAELLFLDEPTTGLDVGSRRALWREVRKLIEAGRTVVLTTHNIEEADALADRIVLLDHGRIVSDGTPAQIKNVTSASRIAAVTQLEPAAIEALPGVTRVRRDTHRTEVFASRPEPVVRELLALDPGLRDLEVTRATLEEAFLTLTRSATETASA